MSQPKSDNIRVNAAKPVEDKEGLFVAGIWRPYVSLAEARSSIPIPARPIGLTVKILKSGVNTEYWWRDGTADDQLIEKLNPDIVKGIGKYGVYSTIDDGQTVFMIPHGLGATPLVWDIKPKNLAARLLGEAYIAASADSTNLYFTPGYINSDSAELTYFWNAKL